MGKVFYLRQTCNLLLFSFCCCVFPNTENGSDFTLGDDNSFSSNNLSTINSLPDEQDPAANAIALKSNTPNVKKIRAKSVPTTKNKGVLGSFVNNRASTTQSQAAFPWDKYFSGVIKHFTQQSISAVEQDLNDDVTTADLSAVFTIMRHFSIQNIYQKSFYSTDITERTNAMEQASFYTKLILLGRGLVYLKKEDIPNVKKALNKWLSFHDAPDSKIGKNLQALEEQANEFLAKSFLQPAPTDFSSAVRRSFEWCETLLDRIKLIEEFRKTLTPNNDDTQTVVISDFSTRCAMLSTFERFCMLTSKYMDNVEELTAEDFSDFLGGILLSIGQISDSNASHTSEPPLSVSQNSLDCLNYLTMRTWYGYDYSPEKAIKIETDPNAQKLISVKNFLKRLKNKTMSAKQDVLNGGPVTDKILKAYNPLFLFMPEKTNSNSQQPAVSLENLLNLLTQKYLISQDEAKKILS